MRWDSRLGPQVTPTSCASSPQSRRYSKSGCGRLKERPPDPPVSINRPPHLADALEVRLPSLRRVPRPLPLTTFEAAEAVFVSGDPDIEDAGQLRGRDVVIVHTIRKATNLPVVGHAVFSAALIKEREPRSVRSVILAMISDPVVEAVASDFSVETLSERDIQRLW